MQLRAADESGRRRNVISGFDRHDEGHLPIPPAVVQRRRVIGLGSNLRQRELTFHPLCHRDGRERAQRFQATAAYFVIDSAGKYSGRPADDLDGGVCCDPPRPRTVSGCVGSFCPTASCSQAWTARHDRRDGGGWTVRSRPPLARPSSPVKLTVGLWCARRWWPTQHWPPVSGATGRAVAGRERAAGERR